VKKAGSELGSINDHLSDFKELEAKAITKLTAFSLLHHWLVSNF